MAFRLPSMNILTSPDTLLLIIFTTLLIAAVGDVLSFFFSALTPSKCCESNYTSISMVHQHDTFGIFFVMTQSFYQITQDAFWSYFLCWFRICATFKPKLKNWRFISTSQYRANYTYGSKNQQRDKRPTKVNKYRGLQNIDEVIVELSVKEQHTKKTFIALWSSCI